MKFKFKNTEKNQWRSSIASTAFITISLLICASKACSSQNESDCTTVHPNISELIPTATESIITTEISKEIDSETSEGTTEGLTIKTATISSDLKKKNVSEPEIRTSRCLHYSPIRNINVEKISNNKLNFFWDDISTPDCPSNYSIYVRETACPSCSWSFIDKNEPKPSITINVKHDHLEYDTEYDFIVTPTAFHFRGHSIKFKTMERPLEFDTIPGVRNFNYTLHDNYTIHFTWQKPQHPEDPSRYLIYWQDTDAQTYDNQTVTVEEWIVNDVEPCSKYNFQIFAEYGDEPNREQSEEISRFITIESALPGPVNISSINSTSVFEPTPLTKLQVTWTPPQFAPRCAKLYIIHFWRKHPHNGSDNLQDLTVLDTKIEISNLDACEVYHMKIIPAIDNETLGTAFETEINVVGREPGRPNAPNKAGSTSRSLNLVVENTDIGTVCQLLVAKFVCIYEGSEPTSIENDPIVHEEIINNQMPQYFSHFEGLEPYSLYSCSAQLINVIGFSNESFAPRFLTDEDVPGRPKTVSTHEIEADGFTASWEEPQKKNGKIIRYEGYLQLIEVLYTIGPNCPPLVSTNRTFLTVDSQKNETITSLYSYSKYSIQVAAATSKGLGAFSDPNFVTTLTAPSDSVQNFNHSISKVTSTTKYDAVVSFTWSHPCKPNGHLKYFAVKLIGFRFNYIPHTVDLKVETVNQMNYKLDVKDLMPGYAYNTSIQPITEFKENEIVYKDFRTPAGVPRANHIANWGFIETSHTPNPTKNVKISIRRAILESDQGEIKYIAILLAQQHCQPHPVPDNGLYEGWPVVAKWSDVQGLHCIPQYQTTPKSFVPREHSGEYINFMVGDDDECTETHFGYCNGPLRPGTEYVASIRILTETGYSDTVPMFFETENLINILVIVVGVASLLLFAFIVGLMILYKTGTLSRSSSVLVSPYLNEPNDVTPKSFVLHYNELIANKNEKLLKEYKTIENLPPAGNMTHNAAKQNASRNRYSNILPFDFNRVVLSSADGDPDYINASYVDGFKQDKEYIATQGPKDNTCGEFWRMIIELRVETIVMLTSFKEGTKVKCAEYFPQFNEHRYYDDVVVKCNQEIVFATYKKRIFMLERGNQLHQVTHYHFLKWLDHDCPKNSIDLIKFVKVVRNERKALFVPFVVHCSAGVGRTGTLIALDIIIQKIKHEKKLNIYEIVKQLRMQRVKMVQTPGQYIFLYKCAYDIVVKEKDWKQRLKERLNGKEKELEEKPLENVFINNQLHKL